MKITYKLPTRPAGFIMTFILSLILVQCKDMPVNTRPDTSGNKEMQANDTPPTLPDGAYYKFSVPDHWDNLVIYAHGYVNPQEDLALPQDSIGDKSLPDIVNKMGMAYATTSYRNTGLIGPKAVDDLVELANKFTDKHGKPKRIYLVGASEGAMVTTLAVEQHPDVFSGGLAGCGPIGSFKKQINYLGDFNVLFNYYFPDIKIGTPAGVPDSVINNWLSEGSSLKQRVRSAIDKNPDKARTLLKVGNVPVKDESDLQEIKDTIFSLLNYNILATNNAVKRLNGHPYGNANRMYTGTGSAKKDSMLNKNVERLHADSTALTTINNDFETSGDLSRPLVDIHTTGDQEVPFWHEILYKKKVLSHGDFLLHSELPIIGRYGHCNFKIPEVMTGFAIMVLKVSLQNLTIPGSLFSNEQEEQRFLDLSHQNGAHPIIRRTPSPELKFKN